MQEKTYMIHTLKEFCKFYNPNKIKLIIADHLIDIDTELKGLYFIIRHFNETKFYCVSHEDGLLVLSISEE